jgi:DNA-binding IclR family transcriptional regulator
MTNVEREGVSTTARSLEIVEYLQREDGATMRELVSTFDVSKSTVHKHLTTLRNNGYVTKRGEVYRLGLAFFNKGQYVESERAYLDIADDIVDELDSELKEDIEFVVENAGRGLVVAESTHKRNRYDGEFFPHYRGRYYHLHAMAAGKVLLARFSEERVRSIVDRWGLPGYTDSTVVDVEELLEELRRTSERGFALSDEEFSQGLRAVACCVDDPEGNPLGALAVCAPIYRMTGEEFTETIPRQVATYARRFEDRLEEAVFTDRFEDRNVSVDM